TDPDIDKLTNLDEYRYGFNPQLADSNGDGISDLIELMRILSRNGKLIGDIDGDGSITAADVTAAQALWDKEVIDPNYVGEADYNLNGRIGIQDLLRINAIIGATL
ncbi:MAG: dockerin type I domain-containing protein, partial [Mariprofundales bacterium]